MSAFNALRGCRAPVRLEVTYPDGGVDTLSVYTPEQATELLWRVMGTRPEIETIGLCEEDAVEPRITLHRGGVVVFRAGYQPDIEERTLWETVACGWAQRDVS